MKFERGDCTFFEIRKKDQKGAGGREWIVPIARDNFLMSVSVDRCCGSYLCKCFDFFCELMETRRRLWFHGWEAEICGGGGGANVGYGHAERHLVCLFCYELDLIESWNS